MISTHEKRISPTLTVSQALEEAFTHHSQGNLAAAERLYEAILAADADEIDALHLLGVVRRQQGRHEEAIRLIGGALSRDPDYVEAHVNLGVALNDIKRHEEAIASYQRALAIDPEYAGAHYNTGVALTTLNRHGEAVASYQRAVAINPTYVEAHFNLGISLGEIKRNEAAIASYRQALEIKPDYAKAHFYLGNALREENRLAEAEASYRRAFEIKPDYIEAHINLGAVLKKQGRLAEAEAGFRRALEINPVLAEANFNLGNVLEEQGRLADAEATHRRALEINPDYADAHCNLGNVLMKLGRHSEAEASLRRALELKPDQYLAHNSLGNVLMGLGRSIEAGESFRRALALAPDFHAAHSNLGNALMLLGPSSEAEASYRRAMELNPDFHGTHSNLLLALNYTSRRSRAELFEEHLAWARRHEAPVVAQRLPHANARDPGRRLRVGYVSPDFRRHSVAYFIEPVLARHDRGAFEVYCYSNVAAPDLMTQRLMGLADCARSIVGLSDARAAELVRSDGIDILVDLAGHTANGRLGLFALKPAPVQVGYLGYPNTSGLGAIDWRLTDIHADPPGDGEEFHSEQLARLPQTFLCYQPPKEAPEVQPPPSLKDGGITFASFNVLAKVSPEVIHVWAQLLDRVPGSRLLLKAQGLAGSLGRAHLLGEFARHGIGGERLMLLPKDGDFSSHLARYHEVDIGLDPFPYNGTTTTLEALWMGVPVVSLAGDRHAARVGASILANLGLDGLIADSIDEYLALAAVLAADAARLASLRETMRERLAASPLRDEANFTRLVERAYREMWRRWCANEAPARLDVAPV